MRWREEEEDEFVFEKWGLKLEKASFGLIKLA